MFRALLLILALGWIIEAGAHSAIASPFAQRSYFVEKAGRATYSNGGRLLTTTNARASGRGQSLLLDILAGQG